MSPRSQLTSVIPKKYWCRRVEAEPRGPAGVPGTPELEAIHRDAIRYGGSTGVPFACRARGRLRP
jgi:hypothetical protein